MRTVRTTGAIALALTCMTTITLAGETSPTPASVGNAPVESPAWLASIAGEKLVAVDGSTITLSLAEGGLALALLSPNGATQKSTFAFMSDRLGTISDDSDASHVTGFFRETDTGLEAQFADGRTESLVANMAGGISLTVRASAGDTSCTSWYPQDHVFGAAERRAALAAYAERLGLGPHSKKAPRAEAVCVPAIRVARTRTLPSNAAQPLLVVTHPTTMPARPGTAVPSSSEAALIPVAVRTSDVHLVDAAVAAPLAALPQAAPPPASVAPVPAPMVQAPVPQAAPAQTIQASAPQPATMAMVTPSIPAGSGASDCLSVDTDGSSLGFRNHCAYGVQFAYCLQKASDPAAACSAGSRTGAVAANGFAALLLDTNIKSADAEHDFRWVGCSGNAGDVVAHLDRADPPAGRCVRANAS